MFIDEKELNLNEEEWEQKFRKLVIDMLNELIKEIKNLYETGEEGAKYFFEFNIIALIENFIGTKYLNDIQNYDDNLFTNFVENIFSIIKAEEIINKCDNSSDKNKTNEEDKKEGDKKEEKKVERPSLLSIDEIFKIANKDKERLEKEEKDKNGNNNAINNNDNKKFSDFYYLTSLFKN